MNIERPMSNIESPHFPKTLATKSTKDIFLVPNVGVRNEKKRISSFDYAQDDIEQGMLDDE